MLKTIKSRSKTFLFLCLALFLQISSSAINAANLPEFDYDGKADFGVFRPSDRMWYSYSTEKQAYSGFQWGLATDVLVPADYDGDGLTDYAVWRPETGVWYINRSRDRKLFAVQWGTTSVFRYGSIADVPVPADYDGDGLTDFAV